MRRRREVEREYQRLLAGVYGRAASVRGQVVIRPRPNATAASVIDRSFDMGEPVIAEYDVAAANPRFDARRYAVATCAAPTEAGPGPFDVGSDGEPGVPPPRCEPRRPTRQSQASWEPRGAGTERAAEPSVSSAASRASRFTQRRVQELVKDNDLLSDIQSILSSRDGPAGRPGPVAEPSPPRPPPPPPAAPPARPTETENGHAIFEEIASKMRYAQAYDLGAVELAELFDSFDADQAKG